FCDVMQWIDVSPYMTSGAKIVAKVRVNRVAGDEKTDTDFQISLSGHSSVGGEELAGWNTRQSADDEPNSWETLEVHGRLVLGTRYILLRLGAYENNSNEVKPGEVEFDGHFIDKAELKLIVPARKSDNKAST
ncbi:MAG: hypothetical protein AAF226_14685, partial [Verrucomicrobiota bacterium]